MRVLLDANLPVGLAALLTPHEVQSVHRRGWSDLDNGELPEAAAREYDALLTLDQSIRHQQNLRDRPSLTRVEVDGCAVKAASPPLRFI